MNRGSFMGALAAALLLFGGVPHAFAETIHSFDSAVAVHQNATVSVTETIQYDFGSASRHGIFRTIPLTNGNDAISLANISVTDENGNAYPFTTSTDFSNETIKIGDPNQLITGAHVYRISYDVLGAIRYFDAYDEIYWNVTGTKWQVPIEKATAEVTLPTLPVNAKTQFACYRGVEGSNTSCGAKTTNGSVWTFSDQNLSPGEGLTVAVGFPKNVVVYVAPRNAAPAFSVFYLWPILIPILVFIYGFVSWFRFGRDAKGRGVVIPEYEPPAGISPLAAKAIIKERVSLKDLSAEFIYLATKGYLSVTEVPAEKMLGMTIESASYSLTLLKPASELAGTADQDVLDGVFGESAAVGSVVALDDLRYRRYAFNRAFIKMRKQLFAELTAAGCFKQDPEKSVQTHVLQGFGATVLAAAFGLTFFVRLNNVPPVMIGIFVASIVLSTIIAFVFSNLMPARSEKGAELREDILGFKMYLQIAEKDRLEFHNAPEKTPELFQAFLPYAMALGVTAIWAKEFESVTMNPPEWYHGGNGAFSPVLFATNMNSFSSSFNTATASGSGGGGGVGGGGGGGGGGSW